MTDDSAVNGGRNQSNMRGRYKGKDARDEISPTVLVRNPAAATKANQIAIAQRKNGCPTSDFILSKQDSQNSNDEGSKLFFQRPLRNHQGNSHYAAQEIPSRVPVGARRNLSKSIIVHHSRKTNIMQSLGRYNEVMSQENFE